MKIKLVSLMLCAAASLALAQDPAPASLDALQWTVGGKWKTDSKWANGNPFKAVARFESILGGKFIRAESVVIDESGQSKPRDIVIFSVTDGRLQQHVFNADGNTRIATGTIEADGTLVFEWQRANADGTSTALKQRIRQVDANTSSQQVLMHIRGEWHTLIDSTWTRSPE